MELSLALMKSIASMLLWVAVGYATVKSGLVPGESSKVLSKLTVYVFCPCMIFHAFQIELTHERMVGFLTCLAASTAMYVVWIVLSRALRKPLGLHPVDEASLVYGNVGNLMLPLVGMTLGEEMVFYASAVQIPFNLFFWSHGISVIGGSTQFEWKRIVKNFNLWAVVIGLVFLAFQWKLPELLDTGVAGLSNMVAPSSMMVIGMVLAGTTLKSIFTSPRGYGVAAGRLVVFPLIALGCLWLTRVPALRPDLLPALMVAAITFGAPAASNVSALSVVFDEEPEQASRINILSLFLCVLTIPLYIGLFQVLFGA